MTGLKYETHGEKVLLYLLPYLQELDTQFDTKILSQVEPTPLTHEPFNIVLINSDFSIGYKVKRELVHREIVEAGMYSSYEPCIYPGVNIKYYYNQDTDNGICRLSFVEVEG